MLALNNVLQYPAFYRDQLKKRFRTDTTIVDKIVEIGQAYKESLIQLERLRAEKNKCNEVILTMSAQEKKKKIKKMKVITDEMKVLDKIVSNLDKELNKLMKSLPNVLREGCPLGTSDNDNPVIEVFGKKPKYDFVPKPYRELEVYKKYISQEDGAKAMGSRGYYMRGEIARFQKVLFDYVLDKILENGYEMFYVPLMLNERVLMGTGHLPDFDGQQYEVKIDESRDFYLIGSSEPAIMGYFMNKNMGDLKKPVLATCWSTCFRKEAGSYGKDQQGILRVHQFEKVEMVIICRPEDSDSVFEKNAEINESIYSSLGMHYRKVEVCSGDMPGKHCRQQDYDVWFPGVERFREIGSNGNASDFQNRGLGITYVDDNGNKCIPWGLNNTGVTFRTGLGILEQFQTAEGKVKVPKVLQARFGKEYLE